MGKRVLQTLLVAATMMTGGSVVLAQQAEPARPWFDAKLGVVFSSRLVRDNVASVVVGREIPVGFAPPVELELSPAPVITLSAGYPLRPRSSVEASASYGLGRIVARDATSEWDVQEAGLATAAVGLRHTLSPWLDLHGGVGVTKYVAESRGIFAAGSDVHPLVEFGASTQLDLPVKVLFEARMQAHSFGTAALRRDGGSNGQVLRLLLQTGVRAGGAR